MTKRQLRRRIERAMKRVNEKSLLTCSQILNDIYVSKVKNEITKIDMIYLTKKLGTKMLVIAAMEDYRQ